MSAPPGNLRRKVLVTAAAAGAGYYGESSRGIHTSTYAPAEPAPGVPPPPSLSRAPPNQRTDPISIIPESSCSVPEGVPLRARAAAADGHARLHHRRDGRGRDGREARRRRQRLPPRRRRRARATVAETGAAGAERARVGGVRRPGHLGRGQGRGGCDEFRRWRRRDGRGGRSQHRRDEFAGRGAGQGVGSPELGAGFRHRVRSHPAGS